MTRPRLTLLDTVTVVMVVVIATLAVWVAVAGPTGPIAMHFDLQGRPDRWGDRREMAGLLAFMTAMTALTAGAMSWYARRSDDPSRRRGLEIGQLIALLAIGGTTAILWTAILGQSSVGAGAEATTGWTMALMGAIFVATGAFLGRVAPNPLIGVRTPWSFKSRRAWDRSNRLAGRLFFWLGLATLIAAPLVPQPAGFVTLTAAVLIAAAWSVFESWRVWKSDPDRQPF
ncbi:SdpI family protein [Brevundimonas sp.]|jgi:uncharacterized membrane protein|uniref:SdpI family protein n=1 Tax=Brevundimonas sp. TaxID=1871086 RepID=UPI003782E791